MQKNYIEIAKCYFEIFETVKSDDKLEYLKLLIIFLILSPYSNEQSDFINRVNTMPEMEKLQDFKSIITLILTIEVISWKSLLEKAQKLYLGSSWLSKFFKENADMETFWEEFRLRIIEHNIRTVERYYKRITTSRLASLLILSEKETELHLGRMVVSGSVYAKIDRPHGIISFRKAETASNKLNAWSNDLDSLLKIVETTCHLIERENMIHKLNQ